MNNPSIPSILLLSVLLLTSCVDEVSLQLPASETNILVVEGIICSDSLCSITLSHTIALDSIMQYIGCNQWVDDAAVTVCSSDGMKKEAEGHGQGVYLAAVGTLSPSAKYWIDIEWQGHTYHSEPQRPLGVIDIDNVRWEQDSAKMVGIYVTSSYLPVTEPCFLRWTCQQGWLVQTPLNPEWLYDPDRNVVRKFNDEYGDVHTNVGWHLDEMGSRSITASTADYQDGIVRKFNLLTYSPNDIRFNSIYYLRVNQQVISHAEYEYERQMKQYSEGMSGIFTPLPSFPPSNISCTTSGVRAIGFVSVSMGISSSLLCIKAVELEDHKPIYAEWVPSFSTIGKSNAQCYNDGFRIGSGDEFTYRWTYRWCVDCRDHHWGSAQLDEPDFFRQFNRIDEDPQINLRQ